MINRSLIVTAEPNEPIRTRTGEAMVLLPKWVYITVVGEIMGLDDTPGRIVPIQSASASHAPHAPHHSALSRSKG
jgi:hypothetical protein